MTPLRFPFGEVVVLDARPAHTAAKLSHPMLAKWPCPGCEKRQALDDAWILLVHNEAAASEPWDVIVCAICARSARAAQREAEDNSGHGSAEPGDTLTSRD
jgi:hypothetical protein